MKRIGSLVLLGLVLCGLWLPFVVPLTPVKGDLVEHVIARWDWINNMTGWDSDLVYCSTNYDPTDGLHINDNEAGHTYGYAIFADNPYNLYNISKFIIEVSDVAANVKGVLRIKCANGTWKDLGSWTSTGTKTITYTTPQYFNITRIGLGWTNLDNNGHEMVVFDYLIVYETVYKEWHYEDVGTFSLLAPLFEGMLLAGVSLIGLCLIPTGTAVGALMVKAKKFNEDNWLLPLMIVLIGFALFIGGMA